MALALVMTGGTIGFWTALLSWLMTPANFWHAVLIYFVVGVVTIVAIVVGQRIRRAGSRRPVPPRVALAG